MTYRAHLVMVAAVVLAACGDDTSFDQVGQNGGALATDGALRGKAGWKVGGTVSGLAGTGLVLDLNGDEALGVETNGRFSFVQKLSTGAIYSVTVKTQPTSVVQSCAVLNGAGLVDGNVKSIEVSCSPTGSYRETGGLSAFAPRYLHTATRLRDGKVLIAGGHPDPYDWTAYPTASAELYDPRTGTFTPTGSMTQGRCGHTATLLPDGKVLIAGGANNSWAAGGWTSQATAELYDPETASFRPVGWMRHHRMAHTATLLDSGKVLLVAGWITDIDWIATAEIYDPATETFTDTGSPYVYRFDHSATLLGDGRVLIVGGNGSFLQGPCWYDGGPPQPCLGPTLAELYSPATGKFARLGDVTGITALLSNGKVLIVGGDGALLYDPATNQFSNIGAHPQLGVDDTATLLADGTVLLTGSSTSEIFDPGTLAFTPTGGIGTLIGRHTETLLRNGKVLVVDGNSSRAYLYETIPPIK